MTEQLQSVRSPMTPMPHAAPSVAVPAGRVPLPSDRAAHHGSGFAAGLRRLGAFLWWIVTGFGLAGVFRRRHGPHYKLQEIVVYSVHRAFFLWPLILIGFVGAWVVHSPWALRHWPAAPHAMGWIYIWVLVYTFVSLLFDISTARFLLWAGIFLFVWLLGRYVEDVKQWHALSAVFAYMRHLQPTLDRGSALVMSWLLLGPWVGSLFHSFTNGRKRFTPNEIGESFLGDGSELTDRAGLKFRTRYRDLFETLLGIGAGDLVAVDGTGTVVKRWENVLFLFFLWGRMDEILHQRSAVVDNAPEDPVEVEEVRHAPGGGS